MVKILFKGEGSMNTAGHTFTSGGAEVEVDESTFKYLTENFKDSFEGASDNVKEDETPAEQVSKESTSKKRRTTT